jgi:hypothetical protein
LRKPIDGATLRALLRELLERHAGHRARAAGGSPAAAVTP